MTTTMQPTTDQHPHLLDLARAGTVAAVAFGVVRVVADLIDLFAIDPIHGAKAHDPVEVSWPANTRPMARQYAVMAHAHRAGSSHTAPVTVAAAPGAVLIAALKAIGVELRAEAVDTPTFNQRVIRGDSELSLIGSGGVNSDLAVDYLRLVYSSKATLTQKAQGYSNPEIDDLTQKQLNTVDEAERKRIVSRIQEIIARDVPLLRCSTRRRSASSARRPSTSGT